MSSAVLLALLAGIGLSLIACSLGCFIVWRRMAYLGDSLAHSALLGIALGLVMGISPYPGIIATCAVFAGLLLWMQSKKVLANDTLLGILAHAGLAIGLVVISLLGYSDSHDHGDHAEHEGHDEHEEHEGHDEHEEHDEHEGHDHEDHTQLEGHEHETAEEHAAHAEHAEHADHSDHVANQGSIDIHDFLFGDILSITGIEVLGIYIAGAVALFLLFYNWSSLLLVSINEDLARAENVKVFRSRLLLMFLMTIVVALATHIVGILLITSLLIIPAATARQLTRSPEAMAGMSCLLGIVSVIIGIHAGALLGTPAGPSIVTVSSLLFALLFPLSFVFARK